MKKEPPFISILMRSYNDSQWIGKAIESILSQTFSRFELLIIDDGSEDGTPTVIRTFKDSRIRLVLHRKHLGCSETLNEGLALCSYPLVARMNPENISHPWRLQKLAAYMEDNPKSVLVGSWVKWMDADNKYIRVEGSPDDHLYFNFIFGSGLHDFSAIYRKEAISSVGGYNNALGVDLIWRLALRYPIHTIEEPLQGSHLKEHDYLASSSMGTGINHETKRSNHRLHYFLDGTEMTEDAIYCFQHNFWPPKKPIPVQDVYETIALLKEISNKIISVENPNRSADTIRSLTAFKQNYLIRNISSQLTYGNMWRLLWHYRQPAFAFRQSFERMGLLHYKSYYP